MPGGVHGAAVWARLTQETGWAATFPASPAAGTQTWADIDENNGFMIVGTPQVATRMTAPNNKRRRRVSQRIEYTGTWKTKMFPEQAELLLPWALSPAAVSGRLQLPSMAIDWWDGTVVHRQYGVRVERLVISSDSSSDCVSTEYTLRGKSEDGTPPVLAAPAASLYPQIREFCHQDSAGLVELGTSGGTVISEYESMQCTVSNVLKPHYFAERTIGSLNYCGRTIDLTLKVAKDSDAYRLNWEDQDTMSLVFKWSLTVGTDTYAVTLDFSDTNYIQTYNVDRPLDDDQFVTLNFQTFEDQTEGPDLTLTVTAP